MSRLTHAANINEFCRQGGTRTGSRSLEAGRLVERRRDSGPLLTRVGTVAYDDRDELYVAANAAVDLLVDDVGVDAILLAVGPYEVLRRQRVCARRRIACTRQDVLAVSRIRFVGAVTCVCAVDAGNIGFVNSDDFVPDRSIVFHLSVGERGRGRGCAGASYREDARLEHRENCE